MYREHNLQDVLAFAHAKGQVTKDFYRVIRTIVAKRAAIIEAPRCNCCGRKMPVTGRYEAVGKVCKAGNCQCCK